ncbi:hypothetical protein SLEP1_g47624 [Rubroshorea leprosula]|uniref:Retrovirus-related Pol polyprotein from transposon TNT 1-94-like beta-barrel domain-containing protein n=1 Tax=Rubroshorea leprosula TaxID=152421 RepID=A0AAV5LRZ1_9ROSI|nr:hypothetical protein SLEP1_g47624 [Rubroshorea leprosula]
MLVSLPDRFEPKVAAIEESCDLSRLSIKALNGKLQAHEKRLAMRSDKSVEGAFQAKHKGKYLVASSDGKPRQVQQANFTEDQNEEDYMFVAMHSCFVTSEDSWYVDSGCTNHMVRDVKLFTKLDRSIRTRVKLGNGYVVQAEGKGNVSI